MLPLSIAPRFVPLDVAAEDWLAGTSPSAVPEVTVHGNPGFPVATLHSVNHAGAALTHDALGISAHVLADPTRDFRLRWTYAFDEPQVAFLHDGEHLLVLVEPPSAPPQREDRVPRELIWVLDTSCSMTGVPWERTRATVLAALQDLDPSDRFQLVGFSNDATSLFAAPMPATADRVDEATAWVESMQPGGGTELFKGVREALAPPTEQGLQRVVTFFSDGQIGTEIHTLEVLEAYRGATRVHSLAVGDQPNRYMMEQLAHLGGGRFMAPELGADPEQTARTLMEVMERPVLAGVQADWGAMEVDDLQPIRIPLLYPGQPLVLVGRFHGEPDTVQFSGTLGTDPWTVAIEPQLVQRGRAVASTWARQQIQALQDRSVRDPGFDPRPQGLAIATEYSVLSPWTAFFAVDPTSDAFPSSATGDVTAQALDTGYLQRVPSGRSYQTATAMAAGVQVGATAGGNANIGGAASNENPDLLEGASIADPVTGTFRTNFHREASPGLGVSRLADRSPRRATNQLSLRAAAHGTVGSGLGGGAEVAVEGPLVRDRLAIAGLVRADEDRTATDTQGNQLELGTQTVQVSSAASLGANAHTAVAVALSRAQVSGDSLWTQQVSSANLDHLQRLRPSIRLHSTLDVRRTVTNAGPSQETTLAAALQQTFSVELQRHTLGARLRVEGLDRLGLLEAGTVIDRYRTASAGDKLRQRRGGLVFEDLWTLTPRWRLASSLEANLTHAGDLQGFVGGGLDLFGQPTDALAVRATVLREAAPLRAAAGPGVLHAGRLEGSVRFARTWFVRADVGLDLLQLEQTRMGQGQGRMAIERPLSRRWSALARYTHTKSFGVTRWALPGGDGLQLAPPPHQLHAEAAWALPTDPWTALLTASFDADLAGWTNLAVGITQNIDLPRGRMTLGVRAANLLDSEEDVVLDAIDGRFLVVGRQRGRRVEVDLGWSF